MKTLINKKLLYFTPIGMAIFFFSAVKAQNNVQQKNVAENIIKPSAVFQIQKTDPGKLKDSLQKIWPPENFDLEERQASKIPMHEISDSSTKTVVKENNLQSISSPICSKPPLLLSGFEG